MNTPDMNRRTFLKTASFATAAVAMPNILRSQGAGGQSPNNKLNIACCGVGGRGYEGAIQNLRGENFVAFCDVDDERAAQAFGEFPGVPRFRDFRVMLDKMGNKIDAVTVAVPDHMHAYISIWAMKHGLHVYCQKPLCQTVHEARVMARVAAETKVVTQMGTQMSSMPANMRTVELIQSGALGEITEIHMETDRPIWPQGFDRPAGEDKVPANLNWDLWQGAAPARPFLSLYPKDHPVYNPRPEKKHQLDFKDAALDPVPPVGVVYHPFVWRGWVEYGTGVIGDGAGHSWNVVVWALDPGPLSAVEVLETSGMTKEQYPDWSVVRFEWAQRGVHPPLTIYHYDGGKTVPKEVNGGSGGTVWIGTKGSLPPVNAFWSVTMYDGKTQFLIENPINRYLINSPMLPSLKTNPDGSLTLYIQKDSPGKDKESNWLPAPNGTFSLYIRAYWADKTILDGTWMPPNVEKVK